MGYPRGSMGYDAIVLASASERRSQLLIQIGVRHRIVGADLDETPLAGEKPLDYVQRLAAGKAQAVVARQGGLPDAPCSPPTPASSSATDCSASRPTRPSAWRCSARWPDARTPC